MLQRRPLPSHSPTRLRTRPRLPKFFPSPPALLPFLLAGHPSWNYSIFDGVQVARDEAWQRRCKHVEPQHVPQRGGLRSERRRFHSETTGKRTRRIVRASGGLSFGSKEDFACGGPIVDVGRTGCRAHRQTGAPHLSDAGRGRAAISRSSSTALLRPSPRRSLPSSPQHVATKPLLPRCQPKSLQIPLDVVLPPLQPFDTSDPHLPRSARDLESSSRHDVVLTGNSESATIFVRDETRSGHGGHALEVAERGATLTRDSDSTGIDSYERVVNLYSGHAGAQDKHLHIPQSLVYLAVASLARCAYVYPPPSCDTNQTLASR